MKPGYEKRRHGFYLKASKRLKNIIETRSQKERHGFLLKRAFKFTFLPTILCENMEVVYLRTTEIGKKGIPLGSESESRIFLLVGHKASVFFFVERFLAAQFFDCCIFY